MGTLEINAACAMLHSFYTEIEKIFKLIAREWDGSLPTSESWHRELLRQMAAPTDRSSRDLDRGSPRTSRGVPDVSSFVPERVNCNHALA